MRRSPFRLRADLHRRTDSLVVRGIGTRWNGDCALARVVMLCVGAALLVVGCRTTKPVAADVDAVGNASPPGSRLTGVPVDLGAPDVVNRRDFVYAVTFDAAGDELAFVHHVSTHMELTVTGLRPLAPRFQEKVNASEFDIEDLIFVGEGIVVPSRQGTLKVLARDDGHKIRELVTGESLLRVASSPDGAVLAVSTAAGRVLLVDAASLSLRGEARIHDDEIRGLAFLPDGRLLTASQDGLLRSSRVGPASQPVAHLATQALSSGDRAFLAHIDGVRAVSTVRDARLPTTVISRAAVKRLGLTTRADGATLTVATAEGTEQLPAVDVGALHLRTLHLGGVVAALCDSCVPNGAELVLGQDILARAVFAEDVAHDEYVVRPVGEAADGARLVEGALAVAVEHTLSLPGPATDLDVAPNATDGPAVLVAFSAARAERSFELHDAERKGRYPPSSPQSGAAFVDLGGFTLGRRFVDGHLGFTVTAAVSPDGRTVVTGGWDKRVLVWDAVAGEIVTERSLAWLLRRVRVGPRGDVVAVAAWTPVNALGDGNSEPALVLYPLVLDGPRWEKSSR